MRFAILGTLMGLVIGLTAAEYETLPVITYVERITVAGQKPAERRQVGRLVSELPWLVHLPLVEIPPPGYTRTNELVTMWQGTKHIQVFRETWIPDRSDPRYLTSRFGTARFDYRPDQPLPDLVLDMVAPGLYLPAGCLTATYTLPEDRPVPVTPVVPLSFTGRDAGPIVHHLQDQELAGRRFTFSAASGVVSLTGDINAIPIPGGLGRLVVTQQGADGSVQGGYEIVVENVTALAPARQLVVFLEAGIAYARPQTFVALQTDGDWIFHYRNPQGIELRLGLANFGDQPASAWWKAHGADLLADLPPQDRASLAGFCGFAQNDPMYGWVDGHGSMTGFFSHGGRGFHARIDGFTALDAEAMRNLFLGLRYLMPETAPAPGPSDRAAP